MRLPAWSEEEILALIKLKASAAGLTLRFDDLVVPRQGDVSRYGTGTEQTEQDYGRMLWDYSNGNPSVALHFFRESLGVRQGGIHVRLFQPPVLTDLEDLPSSVYFVLRTIVQLDLALEADVVQCTGLHPADVADSMRMGRSRRYLEVVDGRVRIDLHWYRGITQVLQRQHLLIM